MIRITSLNHKSGYNELIASDIVVNALKREGFKGIMQVVKDKELVRIRF